jgi:hypothetical protein
MESPEREILSGANLERRDGGVFEESSRNCPRGGFLLPCARNLQYRAKRVVVGPSAAGDLAQALTSSEFQEQARPLIDLRGCNEKGAVLLGDIAQVVRVRFVVPSRRGDCSPVLLKLRSVRLREAGKAAIGIFPLSRSQFAMATMCSNALSA